VIDAGYQVIHGNYGGTRRVKTQIVVRGAGR